MGLIFSTAGQKGGVGKTTTVAHLGVAFSLEKKSVLCIDADPQGGLSSIFRSDHSTIIGKISKDGLYHVFRGQAELSEITQPVPWPSLHIVEPGLSGVNPDEPFPEDVRQMSGLLREALEGIRKQYDIILIDCPPGMSAAVTGALAVSDYIVLPVQCEPLALRTLPVFLRYLFHLREERQIHAEIAGILITMKQEQDTVNQTVEDEIQTYLPKDLIFPVAIPRDPIINQLMIQPDHLQKLYEQLEHRSPAIIAYRQLTDHLIRHYLI